MRWLVISYILPGNAQAVLRVLHQRIKLMISGNRCCEYPQLFIIGSFIDHFFPPIAKDIGG